ncbi:MAG: bifunctional DNA primase/polymerase [Pseudolabrys sp.]|nr:bifunctional DNA primase/polymerase [Pseudolabrys sp.]
MGYAAIPVMPGTKRPGEQKRGEWVGKTNWRDEYTRRLPSRFEISAWSQSKAGVCVVCGPASKYLVGVDIDTDDPIIRNAILSALPPTTVSKRGAKGDTRFFRGPSIDKSKSWNLPTNDGELTTDGKRKTYRACDLIGPGRQTVLPPTIHPDTGQPYVWTGPDALEDIDPSELPELLPEHIEAISAALALHGYEAEQEREFAPLNPGQKTNDEDLPIHRRLNNAALENLAAWVPSLGIPRTRRTATGYEALAVWRASNTGQAIERRKLNLKFSPRGIVDFGDGPRPYTPLNLWIAATGCERLDDAYRGLSEALGWTNGHITLPLSKLVRFGCNDKSGRPGALGTLRGCAEELAQAKLTMRNETLHAFAYKLGRCMARGWLSEDEVGGTLWAACHSNGLINDDGEDRVRATFWSGLNAGLKRPAPDPRDRVNTDSAFAALINLKITK